MPRNYLIQVRGGTAAEWATTNPVLAAREPGYDTDNKVFKLGDGATAWADLDGFSIGVVDPNTTLLGNPITALELSRLSGVTGNVQAQLNAKADDDHTHAISDVTYLQATLDSRLPVLLNATPNTNLTATGPQTNTLQAGANIATGECVRLGGASKWLLTDADDAATSTGFLAISLEAKTDTQAMLVALPGSFVRFDTWNWTPGAVLYLSTTAGALTETQPSGTDDVIRVAGYAVSADVIYFNPSPDFITHV
jgi:hypothetical protein